MVLVSIVGNFHSSILPMFYEFKDDITKHILVYDDYKKDVESAKNIQKGLKTYKKKKAYAFELLEYKLDEDSLASLKECAKFLLSQTEYSKNIFINTTDGFSTLTTVLNQALFKKGVNFIAYDRYDNEYNILNKNSLEKFSVYNCLNIKDHFILKGYGVQKSDIKKFAHKNEKQINKLFQKNSKEYNEFIKHPPSNEYVENLAPEYETVKELFLKMGLSRSKIKDPILTGSLYEMYIYNLVKTLRCDDIEIGLKVFRSYKRSEIVNEFDILIMKNNHLHMIECKYRNNIKLEELIYKYIAISNIIDEDGQIVLATKKEPEYNTEIDVTPDRGRVYKRGILSNINVLGGIHKNPIKFLLNIQKKFALE